MDGLESSTIPRVRVRIESLSDLVFGLALSFGSLILIASQPRDGFGLLNNIFTFGFSFMIIVTTWIGYTRTIAVLPAEAPNALVLNLGLLFCVALEPYLFYLVATTALVDLIGPASIAYAIDGGFMFLSLAGLAYTVVDQERRRPSTEQRMHPLLLRRFGRVWKIQAITGIIYLISTLPIFWVETPIGRLRFFLWFSPFLILLATRRQKTVDA